MLHAADNPVPDNPVAKQQVQGPFVYPGNGIAKDMPIWGMRDGLRISIVKTRGPQGLIRLHAPYLSIPDTRVINFISIEPSVRGPEGGGAEERGQSEMEPSRFRKGEQGLSFFASNTKKSYKSEGLPPTGVLSKDGQRLHIFIHTEPLKNGARPVVEIIFHKQFPKTIELRTYAAAKSKQMEFCTLSATMGNLTILRRLRVEVGVAHAEKMWASEEPDPMRFYTWRHWTYDQCMKLPDGRPYAYAFSNFTDAAKIPYGPKLRGKYWHYTGTMTGQFWCGEADPETTIGVNARDRYWKSLQPIPGGPSFENYEMRAPYKSGRRFWFGIIEASPQVDVKKLPIPPVE